MKILLISLGLFIITFFFWRWLGKKAPQTIMVGSRKIQVEIARTPAEREKGLSGRQNLCADCGLLFLFPQKGFYPFWMKEMYFDIDILWLADDRVVDITAPAQKPTAAEFGAPSTLYQSSVPVDKVLEVNAGWVKRNGIKVGDAVK